MRSKVKIGIPMVGGKSWFAGVSIVEHLIKALVALEETERPQAYLIATEQSIVSFPEHSDFVHCFDGIIFLGVQGDFKLPNLGVPIQIAEDYVALFTLVDFLFPLSMGVLPGYRAASWIHDFQHRRLPHFFPQQVISQRDDVLAKIAEQARLIVVTSRDVKNDFHKFYPRSTAVVEVINYRLRQEAEWVAGDPIAVQQKYHLPDAFLLCSNQFWMHKNHKCLFEAMTILKNNGMNLHLVCTGFTGDFRNPQYFSKLMEYAQHLGITNGLHILGIIPRQDQIQLLRRSLFVVQPSLFEGLGLIIQECAALGKHIVLSDLDVHKEQASEYTHFYGSDDPLALARQIAFVMRTGVRPGPQIGEEQRAKELAEKNVVMFGKQFVAIAEQAQSLFM